jgi:GNAT superfamily N-acetyltransferase
MQFDGAARSAEIQALGSKLLVAPRHNGLQLTTLTDPQVRRWFDEACELNHYAGACRRVGRCMRLCIWESGAWAGGIVLGSTFPAIAVRDEAFGLQRFARDYRARGLVSAWASENREYWDRLQHIVNHARTFVFPAFRGSGIAVAAHKKLLTQGRRLWEQQYGTTIAGFDNLCTTATSRMFGDNGWSYVGLTKGYSRDPNRLLSRRLAEAPTHRDNAGLQTSSDATRWHVWVRVFAEF